MRPLYRPIRDADRPSSLPKAATASFRSARDLPICGSSIFTISVFVFSLLAVGSVIENERARLEIILDDQIGRNSGAEGGVQLGHKDSQDPNPLIRALAGRIMGCIRVDKITKYLCDPLLRCLKVILSVRCN
uniref:Uncharacterized protein n=1 Tax=Kalanchoe fedtschenkoi TaxID=63787 RepID=A0A7N0U119_KALFE